MERRASREGNQVRQPVLHDLGLLQLPEATAWQDVLAELEMVGRQPLVSMPEVRVEMRACWTKSFLDSLGCLAVPQLLEMHSVQAEVPLASHGLHPRG